MTRKFGRTELESRLLDRLREKAREEKRRHRDAAAWTGEYGYGAGRAHPSVEFAACEHCGSPAGKLCIGARGPHLGHHYVRAKAYREMLRQARIRLSEEGAGRSR